MIRVVVYSSGEACMQCRMTERLMEAAGVVFERVDLSDPANAELRAHVTNDLGYVTAPVVEAGEGVHWTGFAPDRVKDLISRLTNEGGR